MEQKNTLPLSGLTPNDLLNLFYALKDSPTKDSFYTYFNDIREELTGNHYETSPSNIRRWMSKRNSIKGQNLSRAMAKGIFMDILGNKAAQSMDSIKQFLNILYNSGYDVSVYQDRIGNSSLNFSEASAFLEELISDVVDFAFDIHTSRKSRETVSSGTLLPYYFADTEFADKDSILHREEFIDEIVRNLLPTSEESELPKRNILIYGFGGHGKTSVARVLYGLFRNRIPAIYSSIGWIDYNESLKNSILNAVEANTLFSRDDNYVEINRKLSIVEYVIGELDAETLTGTFFFNLGMMEYTYARKRLASIDYLDTALEKFELESPDNLSRIANLKYQRGYIKSTTQKYRSAAKEDLYEALKIWNVQPEREYEIDMVKDHLGYVLSDQPEHYEEAERYLRAACSSRERRLEMNPSTQNQKDYATTCDNLGCLLIQ